MEAIEDIEIEDIDTDDIAKEYKELTQEIAEKKDRLAYLAERLASIAVDSEDKYLVTAHGAFKAEWKGPRKTYDRKALAKDVYRAAMSNLALFATKGGEVPDLSPEDRLDQAYNDCFRFEPKVTGIKKYLETEDLDEYVEKTSGEGSWTIRVL